MSNLVVHIPVHGVSVSYPSHTPDQLMSADTYRETITGDFSPNLPKKKPCLLPESDTADPLIPKVPRNRLGRRPPSSEPRECMVENTHKALLPPLDEVKTRLTTGLDFHLCVSTYGDSPTCEGVPEHRRRHVMTEGNRSLTPVRAPSLASVPHAPP